MRALAFAACLAALLPCTLALADEDAGPPPEHGAASRWCTDTAHVEAVQALQNQTILDRLATLIAATVPAAKKDLAFTLGALAELRDGVVEVHCTEGLLSPARRAAAQAFEVRATKLVDDLTKAIEAEEKARETVIEPLCEAHWGLDSARATIAHERSNPSGVVNLATLHSAGEAVQYYQAQIAGLSPQYVATRHHAFAGWQSEAACVAETEKAQQ